MHSVLGLVLASQYGFGACFLFNMCLMVLDVESLFFVSYWVMLIIVGSSYGVTLVDNYKAMFFILNVRVRDGSFYYAAKHIRIS